ncbi:MAG TPA: DUF2442 domain-containing protein [Candidatus Binatia bacterium]|jgi:hypothetical protein|nr:DUF2442 domain-containing protein [Candidatus Binatia bacterium]
MSTSRVDREPPRGIRVATTSDALTIDLADGRTVTAPLAWYPRLQHATAKERKNYRWVGQGEGIHWPELDEDLSVEGLLAGRPSGESQRSFQKWLASCRDARGASRTRPPMSRVRRS